MTYLTPFSPVHCLADPNRHKLHKKGNQNNDKKLEEQTELQRGKEYQDSGKKVVGAAAKVGLISEEGEGKGNDRSGAGSGRDGNDEDVRRKKQMTDEDKDKKVGTDVVSGKNFL